MMTSDLLSVMDATPATCGKKHSGLEKITFPARFPVLENPFYGLVECHMKTSSKHQNGESAFFSRVS